jgi:predicted membrane protein DUF2142
VEGRSQDTGSHRMRGIVAAGLLCFFLAAGTSFRMPVFFGADERPHFSYAVRVVQGDLPEINDKMPSSDHRYPVLARSLGLDAVPDVDRGRTIYVANHPPLSYVLAAGPMWLAGQASSDVVAPLTLRLLNAAFMAVGVVLTGYLAMELFAGSPRRRLIGTVAAGLAAVTPNLVGVAAYGHNDGLAFAVGTAALILVVRLLRRGPTPGLAALAAAVGSACALTRASLLPVVAVMAAAGVIGAWRHAAPGRRPQAMVGTALVLAGLPALAGSWFYLRNEDLYGSLTGDSHNLERLGRLSDDRTIWQVLTRSRFHEDMWARLFGSVHPSLRYEHRGWVVTVLVVVTVLGLLARFVRPRAARDVVGIGLGGALVLTGYVVAVTVGVADHVSQGGSMHPRYFLPFVPLVGAVTARAIDALPGRRALGVLAVGGLGWVCASLLLRYGELIDFREDSGRVALPGAAGSVVLTWLAGILAALAFARVALAVLDPGLRFRARPRRQDGSPPGGREARHPRHLRPLVAPARVPVATPRVSVPSAWDVDAVPSLRPSGRVVPLRPGSPGPV